MGFRHTEVQYLVLGFISLNEKQSEPIHGEADVNRPRLLTKVIKPGKI